MLFKTLATFYCIVHTESKQTSWIRPVIKSTLVIVKACWELQTLWAIKGYTLNCTEIQISIMQVSSKQNLALNF